MRRSGMPRRLLQLYVGLLAYGIATALLVQAHLGLDPWDVFHQGLAHRLDLSIGTVVILVGAVVLLLWIPMRERPGLGTVSNMVLIGIFLNLTLEVLPRATRGWLQGVDLTAGVLLSGLASGLYIGARFGPGPRDGLMTGLARRTGRSLRLVRTGLEVTVLAVGWLLGGSVGVGTVAYALLIGPLAQQFLAWFDTRPLPAASVVDVVCVSGEPGGEAIDRDLELRLGVDEGL
jgi:uncharacterized membrane protein YczE